MGMQLLINCIAVLYVIVVFILLACMGATMIYDMFFDWREDMWYHNQGKEARP